MLPLNPDTKPKPPAIAKPPSPPVVTASAIPKVDINPETAPPANPALKD